MGFEHDRIHTETSSVLIREMPKHLVQTPKYWPKPHDSHLNASSHPKNEMLRVDRSTVTLGKPDDFPTFGWDNEYGARRVDVCEFSASKYMVTNGEFLEFVKDGGYNYKEMWTTEGEGWRKHRNANWPFFWSPTGPSGRHDYNLRTVFENVELPMSWPVDVNYHEASAFANWKSKNSTG